MAHTSQIGALRSQRFLALSTASSLALCAFATQPAFAQSTGTPEEAVETAESEDVIIVTGFKKSLESAQNVKRDSDTFVDAITAEDIGALPDRSVAEALQRVPGVNIGRFEKTTDPDRFSVEGTGVIIRGLPYVRSELNGREIFSATGGRELSFNDISPELLGRVEVFKNVTADMVEGAIAGTVNLVTRKPLDSKGLKIGATIGGNYGDLRKEWSPEFSGLISNRWDTDAGSFGLQFGYAYSELKSRTDASQVADPCYRANTFDAPCIRAVSVGSGGFVGDPNFNATNFPPAGALVVPKGAGVRTTDLDRTREAFSAVGQYESSDGRFKATVEWLRSETSFDTEEFALISRVDDEGLFPVPAAGSTWTFDENGVFESGILTQRPGDAYATPFGRGGIPIDSLRFLRGTEGVTEDISLDLKFEATDRLRFSLEAQKINSTLSRDSVFGALSTFANVALDLSGKTPKVEFLAPPGAPADYFSAGLNTYYWFGLDSREKNEGDLKTLSFDAEYDISDEGFFKRARFGARWGDRDRTTRNTNFSTWGNLSAPWAGRAGCAPWGAGPGCQPGAPGTLGTSGFTPGRWFTGLRDQQNAIGGGAFTDEFPNYSQYRAPFANGFQRGSAPTPIQNGAGWFFGGDDFLGEYLSGLTDQQFEEIQTFGQSPERVYCPGEVSTVAEETKAAYARVDFGHEFDGGMKLSGNFGLRYVETTVTSGGRVGLPSPVRFDAVDNGFGNGDGVVQLSEIAASCAGPAIPGIPRGYCSLSAARQAEFAAAHTGEIIIDDRKITFENWLPSFNAKLDVGGGLLFRAAVSKGISRPDLQLFRAGGGIGDNTNALLLAQTLATGPLFALQTGNRNLRPVTSWNYDLSAEWYFNTVGSLTMSIFMKDIQGIVNDGFEIVNYTSPSGVSADVQVSGPINDQKGKLKGLELAYQQTYDFLPGFLNGLGSQLTYTYVDGTDFSNPNLAGAGQSSVTSAVNRLNSGAFTGLQPLAGLSKHTVNATVFYEKGPIALRAAYNWRSAFLITVRDDIFPFSPIWQESTGQLDASIFYSITDQIKVGIQGVNLLDEVTQTSQVVDFDGTRVPRSAFRNDRRYTFLARFQF